jgi:hypothetical protein
MTDCSYAMSMAGVTSFTVDHRQPIRFAQSAIGGSIPADLMGKWEYGDGTTWTAFAVQGQTAGRTKAYNSSDKTNSMPIVTARYVRWTYTSGSTAGSSYGSFLPECFLRPDNGGSCP